MKNEEQISNGFTEMMKGLWDNPDLEEPKLETQIDTIINEILRKQTEYMEKDLVKIIEKNDFITGSMETKIELMKILPGANVIYSPYIQDPSLVYVVKKFNAEDLVRRIDIYGNFKTYT